MRDGDQVPCRVQAGQGGGGVLVPPEPGGGVAAAQADLRDVHLHVAGPVVMAPAGVEGAAGGPFGGVQDAFERGDRFLGQVGQLEVDRAAGGGDLPGDLGHHLPGPVVAVHEPVAAIVDLVAAERVGHV